MESCGASTISAKIRVSKRDRSRAAALLPKNCGRSTSSSGPRTTGTPRRALSGSRSPRQRPGTRMRSAPMASGSRRSIMSAVISAATLTPSWCTRPGERGRGHGFEHAGQALLGELSGQEQQVLALLVCHRLRPVRAKRITAEDTESTEQTGLTPRRGRRAGQAWAGNCRSRLPPCPLCPLRFKLSFLRYAVLCGVATHADLRQALPPARRAGRRRSPPPAPAERSSAAACSPDRRDAGRR